MSAFFLVEAEVTRRELFVIKASSDSDALAQVRSYTVEPTASYDPHVVVVHVEELGKRASERP